MTSGNYWFLLPMVSLAGGLLAAAYFDGMPQAINSLGEDRLRTYYMAWYWTLLSLAGAVGPILGGFLIQFCRDGGINGFKAAVVVSMVLAGLGAFFMSRTCLPEAPVRQTLPVIMSPAILKTYGRMGVIERPDPPEQVDRTLRSLEGRSAPLARRGVHGRLDDPDPDVRDEAVRTLGRMGGVEDLCVLTPLLEHWP